MRKQAIPKITIIFLILILSLASISITYGGWTDTIHITGEVTTGIWEASISDYVWLDNNQNGLQDPGEPGIQGVTVDLYQADDTYISTDITDIDGLYMFEGLTAGDYYLVFTLPTGYGFTNPNQGADDTIDSDVDPTTGYTITTTLDEGENDPSWDAGVIQNVQCSEETAWGGESEGEGNAWWYYFDTSGPSTQTIWAGQTTDVGTVTVSDCNTGEVTITISLTGGWELQNDEDESVKIQGYNTIPTSRPSAGSFTYKGEELTVTFNCYEFYAIHLDVQLCE